MEQKSIPEHQITTATGVLISPDEIRRTLDRILSSRHFSQAPKKRKFVQLICDYHLAGRAKEINEHLIGLEVYERNDRYNPAEDPVVRVAAHDVRKRLEQYYLHEGRDDEIHLEIPIGSYEPVFKVVSSIPAETETYSAIHDRSSPPKQTHSEGRRDWQAWAIGGGLVAVAIIFLAINAWWRTPVSGLTAEQEIYNSVWGPFFTSEDPTIQVLSNPPVYILVNRADPEVIHKKSIDLPRESSKELFDLLKQTSQNEPEYITPTRLFLSQVAYTGIGEEIGQNLI